MKVKRKDDGKIYALKKVSLFSLIEISEIMKLTYIGFSNEAIDERKRKRSQRGKNSCIDQVSELNLSAIQTSFHTKKLFYLKTGRRCAL